MHAQLFAGIKVVCAVNLETFVTTCVRFYQLLHEVTELLHEVTRLCNPLGKPAIDSNAPPRPSSVSGSLSSWRRSPSILIKSRCDSSQKGSPRAVWWQRTARASERGHNEPAMTGGGGGPAWRPAGLCVSWNEL